MTEAAVTSYWTRVSGYAGRNIVSRHRGFVVVERVVPGAANLAGKTILVLSDLHWSGSVVFAEEVRRVVDAIAPTWIVFCGDLVSHVCHLESALCFLASLRALSAKLSVLGNWDLKRRRWLPSTEFRRMLGDAGFEVLVNSSRVSDGVVFAGISGDFKGASLFAGELAGMPHRGFTCVVSHSPDQFVESFDRGRLAGVNLALCGHTHGGQIRIPLFGAVKTSSRYWKRFEYGDYLSKETGTRMLVTSGLGCVGANLRLFCDPELLLVKFSREHLAQ